MSDGRNGTTSRAMSTVGETDGRADARTVGRADRQTDGPSRHIGHENRRSGRPRRADERTRRTDGLTAQTDERTERADERTVMCINSILVKLVVRRLLDCMPLSTHNGICIFRGLRLLLTTVLASVQLTNPNCSLDSCNVL